MLSLFDDDGWIVALLMGELRYMTGVNSITSRIVEGAVSLWRERTDAILICEAEPMGELARKLGVPAESVRVAVPEAGGHTTRLAALRVRAMPDLGNRSLKLVTHRLHSDRAARIFGRLGLSVDVAGLDIPFDRRDSDWKLRSEANFRFYNQGAWIYCFARGWL